MYIDIICFISQGWNYSNKYICACCILSVTSHFPSLKSSSHLFILVLCKHLLPFLLIPILISNLKIIEHFKSCAPYCWVFIRLDIRRDNEHLVERSEVVRPCCPEDSSIVWWLGICASLYLVLIPKTGVNGFGIEVIKAIEDEASVLWIVSF